jgi:hypothetical protein
MSIFPLKLAMESMVQQWQPSVSVEFRNSCRALSNKRVILNCAVATAKHNKHGYFYLCLFETSCIFHVLTRLVYVFVQYNTFVHAIHAPYIHEYAHVCKICKICYVACYITCYNLTIDGLHSNTILDKGPVNIQHYGDQHLSRTNIDLCQLECKM